MQLKSRVEGGGTPRSTRWGLDSEYGLLRDVLLGPIDHFSWQADSNAVARRSARLGFRFDPKRAAMQWEEVAQAYREAGVHVHRLAPDPALPYQIFARDSSVMTPWGALIMQMKMPFRRGEYAACLRFYLDAGIPIYDIVTAGSIEGGDFMVLEPGIAVCGQSGDRSTPEGVEQVRKWFEAEGWEFRTYAFDPHFLHLDVQMGMIERNLAAVCTEAVEPEFVHWLKTRQIRIIDIPYRDAMGLGCNVVALGDERVMVPKSQTSLIDACRAEGLTVLDPDVSMIDLAGGSLHCMCQALHRDSANYA